MPELVACLHRGKLELLRPGQGVQPLESPALEQRSMAPEAGAAPRIVSVTRGRTSGELCYAIASRDACEVFAQVAGSGNERRLFRGPDVRLTELDFSPADEALACTVEGPDGTSAIGVFSDDGKGLRTVTEGDVLDRSPRWSPGGRGEIVYASAGIGRTKAGKAVGRTPFALHRLRFSDSSVEVLMADAQYDYAAAIPTAPEVLYALRRSYDGAPLSSPFAHVSSALRSLWSSDTRSQPDDSQRAHELVRITAKGSQTIAKDVLAFDVTPEEELVYASAAGIFRIAAGETAAQPLSTLAEVEQLVIHW